MKKAKYVGKLAIKGDLVTNGIYDVVEYIEVNEQYSKISIINDYGTIFDYILLISQGKMIFEDVTMEYRDDIINGILND